MVTGCTFQHSAPDVVDRTSDVGAVDVVSPSSSPAQAPLAPPTTAVPPQGHRVERGDTLYGIAWRYGLDYREIARLNGIEAPYRIFIGQQLTLVGAPATGAP
ncbi:MAG: LysM peptidoglycan-binding domain-containing protein, partial [Gammaproteobacteria bacterium]